MTEAQVVRTEDPPMSGLTADEFARQVGASRLETLGMFVAGIAHELNTPMGALNSNHDVLKRALSKLQGILADEVVSPNELAEVRKIVNAVDRVLSVNDLAVERMSRLVHGLRNFGRPDTAEIETVDLHEGIESTLTILGHELKDRVTVVREFGDLPAVECNPHQLNQVFMNLLVNASHAITGPGTITIRTGTREDRAWIQIEDTGCGMSEEVLERAFEPGFTTKKARVGMGLGLLIVRQIVERHSGRISVSSSPGKGTVFSLLLPLRLPSRPAHA
jgi:two-component system NtrC family sensor kinase